MKVSCLFISSLLKCNSSKSNWIQSSGIKLEKELLKICEREGSTHFFFKFKNWCEKWGRGRQNGRSNRIERNIFVIFCVQLSIVYCIWCLFTDWQLVPYVVRVGPSQIPEENQRCGVVDTEGATESATTISCDLVGRYVSVQLWMDQTPLSLSEVEITVCELCSFPLWETYEVTFIYQRWTWAEPQDIKPMVKKCTGRYFTATSFIIVMFSSNNKTCFWVCVGGAHEMQLVKPLLTDFQHVYNILLCFLTTLNVIAKKVCVKKDMYTFV